jgi:glucokinase
MKYYIAVDIGGTQIRSACYRMNSQTPFMIERISTQGKESALDRLCMLVEKTWPTDGQVCGISVAAPGPVDPWEGIILYAPNIPGWKDIHLKNHLQSHFKVPVTVGNDANMAAMGEWKFGSGIGHHHLIYLTISTGIGGGIIMDDKLLLGQRGLAGEMGHITVLPDGPLCGCGKPGHLEALSSGTGIAKWTQNEIQKGRPSSLSHQEIITAKMIHQAAKEGDGLAIEAFNRAGYYLGMALADFLHLFNPTIIILGGGVSRSGELLFKPTRQAIEQFVIEPHYLDNFTLTQAALGDEAGLMGALALAQEYFPA